VHNENWQSVTPITDGLLNLGPEASMLPFRTSKAANHEVPELLCDITAYCAAALLNCDDTLLAWSKYELAREAEARTGKLNAMDVVERKTCDVSRSGKIFKRAADQLLERLHKMGALGLCDDAVGKRSTNPLIMPCAIPTSAPSERFISFAYAAP